MREGAAVLISTHQLQEVQQLCDRLLLLNRGKVLLEGRVQEVRERYADGSLLVRGAGDYAQLPAVEQVAQVNGQGQRLITYLGIAALGEPGERRVPARRHLYLTTTLERFH